MQGLTELLVFLAVSEMPCADYVLLGNYENVYSGCWVVVMEGNKLLVLHEEP